MLYPTPLYLLLWNDNLKYEMVLGYLSVVGKVSGYNIRQGEQWMDESVKGVEIHGEN